MFPLALAAVFGFAFVATLAQTVWYRTRLRLGRISEDDIPFFGIRLFRGLLLAFVLIGIGAVIAALGGFGGLAR